MVNAEETQEDAVNRQRKWHPRVITGGKGPPEPPDKDGHNWLADLEAGTTFVARSRNSKEVDLNLYHVIFVSLPDVMLLKWVLPDGKVLDYYVDPARFSKQFENHTVLGVMKQETSEEDEDGNDHRTD